MGEHGICGTLLDNIGTLVSCTCLIHLSHTLASATIRPILLTMRLLCADDEEDIRIILELALGLDPNVEATIVPSGTELLEEAQRGHWDAVLLDGMMPGIDGYETCRRLKADPQTAEIPVIFLSAKTQAADVEKARRLGAVTTLAKPFDPMTLAAELRSALGM